MNVIEKWAQQEYRPGVSAGAAARQLCRSLGCFDEASTLKKLLEDMLADANRASFDRYKILDDFRQAAPEAAAEASRQSYYRNNPDSGVAQAAREAKTS